MDTKTKIEKVQNEQIPRSLFPFLRWIFEQIYLQKKWWLLPFWLMLVAVGLVLFLTGNGHLLPAIYIAF